MKHYKTVGNDAYNLSKYDRTQITDTTIIEYPKKGGYLLQNWVIKCNDKNNNGKIQILLNQQNQIAQHIFLEQRVYLQ